MKTSRAVLSLLAVVLAGCGGDGSDDDGSDVAVAFPSGSLDLTFGGQGKLATPVSPIRDEARSMAIQPDGKIVVAGLVDTATGYDFALARYNPDGSLDPSFGSGGMITTDVESMNDEASSIALQPDGKIVVAGNVQTPLNGYSQVGLVRYLADGTPDASFDGDGKAVTRLQPYGAQVRSMALQPDGRIVVVGYLYDGTIHDLAAWRFNADGSPDTSFGMDGSAITRFGTGDSYARSVVIQPDGKIVVGGQASSATRDFAVVRYKSDGSLDPDFGDDGHVITDFRNAHDYGHGLAVQSDGKIVLVGRVDDPVVGYGIGLARYEADGTPDAAFGNGGRVITNVGDVCDQAYAVAIQGDGKIVVAGDGASEIEGNDVKLVRYTSDGALDSGFGSEGFVSTNLGPFNQTALCMALQSDGKIVVGGFTGNSYGPDMDFLMARYHN